MKKITDPSKLLPAAKSAAVTRTRRANIKPSSALVTRPKKESALVRAPEKSTAIVRKENKSLEYVNVRMIAIDNLFRNDFANVKKEAEEKRKKEEKQDFTEAEKKLETPKTRKLKFGGGSGDSPSLGFFDRLKRFLFFTTLGWLLPKIIDFLPKLEGIVKTIGTIYKFAEGLFGKLFDGFMTLVKFGGDLKKQTLGFIAGMKGGDYQTEFNKLEKTFDTFVNASIIAGVLAADIGFAAADEFNKWRKKNEKPVKPKSGEPSKAGAKVGAKVTKGRGGKKPTGKPKITGDGKPKSGKAPSWWNKILRGPFAKLKGPLSKFAGAAVPGLGAVVGAADAKARFAAGDRIGGSLASVSASLDGISVILALTGAGAVVAAPLSLVSMGIDAILLINDIGKVIKSSFPGMGWLPTFNKGGRIVNTNQGGGTTVRTTRRAPKPTKVKKPIKSKPPKTKVGRDVGGEKKIVEFYAKDTKDETPIFRNFAAALNFFSGGTQNKEQNRPLNALKKTSKILKDLPFGLGYFAGGAIDIALGQSMDVKKGLSQLSSSIAYMVDSLANQRVNTSMTSLIRDLNAFADGGTVPASRTLSSSYSSVSSGDLISKIIGPTIEQKVNEAMQSIEKDLRSIQQKSAEERKREEDERLRPGGGGAAGGGAAIESIDVGGMSAEDVDALGRMIAAEAGGEDNLGKAGVLAVILNRYRLIKSGKASPSQFNIRGKTRDQVTIRDILFAGGQFTPYSNGSFARTSSSSGMSALAAAIRAGGNDPEKFRKKLIDSGMNEVDADYVVRSVGFSNAETRESRPFSTREVAVGNHVFQQSADVKLTGTIGRMDASIIEAEEIGPGQSLSNRFLRNLQIPLPGITLSGQRYRADRPRGKGAHAGRDYDLPTNGIFYSRLGGEVIFAGNVGGGYGNVVDIYNRALNRTERIAEGTTILPGIRVGSVISPGQPVVQGTHQTGVIHYEIRKGKASASGSVEGTEDPDAFLASSAYKQHLERVRSESSQTVGAGERREYDVIIPLDHHTGRLPDKSLWPNASLGAAGRERQAQNPTAELMRRRLEARGLRVKILRPEDYRTEREYNAALVRFSKAGAVVSALHYDAPRSQGGVGFLARLGASPDKADRDFANRLAPILRRMAAESRGDQIYGGIDTAGNITMSKSGPATAALIELGSLVEQEKRYGRNFWTNPEFIKHIDAIANVTASSVQGRQTPPRNAAQGSSSTQGQFTTTRQLGDAIRNLRPGETVTIPGVGRVSRDKNGKVIYSVDGKGVVPGSKFLGAFDARNRRAQQPPKMQQGGIIKPRGTQLPIPNSYASYESPGSGTIIAIQPYIIEKPSHSAGNRTIAFPVPMGLNNTNKNLESLSRG